MNPTDSIYSSYNHPVDLLQKLIQFNTTNPPGNEGECIEFINQLLTQAGIQSKLLAKSPHRPNLLARLPGQGNAAPLLLYGHVDVVTTEKQIWQHPPFEGKIVDGFLWGRGALDMKGGVAMMLTAFIRAKAENIKLAGDVILTIVSDEETGGDLGAKFLVEEHPEEFTGIRYAIGEFGGYSSTIGKRRFYLIQVAEKHPCWLKATMRGPGGNGAKPVRGGAMAKLSHLLDELDTHYLPVHITPPAQLMLKSISSELTGIKSLVINYLLNPQLADYILKLLGDRGRYFATLLTNTISPTILYGSNKINVIPSEVSVELDGRLLPGFKPDDLINELRSIVGDEADYQVIRYDPGQGEPDMGLFDTLSGILREADPSGIPVPLFLSGFTDGRLFSRLGIQSYGFLPMRMPEDFDFLSTLHAANERIPIEALEFGTQAIYQLLLRFGI